MTPAHASLRRPRTRSFLMCPPTYFDVRYEINAWMDASIPVDTALAISQWEQLVAAYRAAGHRVELLPASPDLPDEVFAANGATMVDGRVLIARFANVERAAESGVHAAWHATHHGEGADGLIVQPGCVNEAEGDFAVLSDTILAGYGFRTSKAAHRELAAVTGRKVIGLELVDPRFYHLDVALTVLDDESDHIAYYPPAFGAGARRTLERHFPDAIIPTSADAYAFGLNAVSDGYHVFLPVGADQLAGELTNAGYQVVPIDLSELRKGGGSVKCCTQELRYARADKES
ncbi:arginine deiminase-related protein [Microlunatus ginsengisoli]|uniref:Arginine deiminase-related protein n=1 Tax=Microlunatus ginsengisoli TaxID=363863 RepID=A0ABP7AJ76_9ACTN